MFPKTIKKHAVFVTVTKQGTFAKTRGIVAVCQRVDTPYSLVGYTASRKVGSAVKRNFAKRRMRALVREFCDEFVPGYAFVLIANFRTPEIKFSDLRANFKNSIRKAKEGEMCSA